MDDSINPPAPPPITPVPPRTVEQDARERAWRTFLWGLLVDCATAIVLVLATYVTDLRWTRDYWVMVGLAVAKSVITSVIAYAARRLVPPAAP